MFTTPQEAEHAFYEALHKADLTLMMRVWADDEEIVCVHPGGTRVIGLNAIQNAWQQIFGNGPMTVTPLQPMILTTAMSAVHVLVEQISVNTPEGDKTANCYTTNIFHKGRTGWKMVLHHASHAPQNIDMFGLHDHPETLH